MNRDRSWAEQPRMRSLGRAFLLLAISTCISVLASSQTGTHTAGFSVQSSIVAETSVDLIRLELPSRAEIQESEPVAVHVTTNAPELVVSAALQGLPSGVGVELRISQQASIASEWRSVDGDWAVLGGLVASEEGTADCTIEIRGSADRSASQGQYEGTLSLEISAELTKSVSSLRVVVIVGSPQTVVTIVGASTAFVNEPTTFEATVDPPATCEIEWSFGDGTGASSSTSPSYTFTHVGEYVVRVMATCPNAGSGSAEMHVEVVYRPPIASLSMITAVGASSVAHDEPIIFSAEASTPGSGDIVLYEWDWSFDGAFRPSDVAGAIVEHSFSEPGEYVVAVRVTDEYGLHDIAALEIFVTEADAVTWSLSVLEDVVGGGGGAFGSLDLDDLVIRGQCAGGTSAEASAGEVEVRFPFEEGHGLETCGDVCDGLGDTRAVTALVSAPSWTDRETSEGGSVALSLGSLGFVDIPYDPALSLMTFDSYTVSFWLRVVDSPRQLPIFQQGYWDDFGVGIHLLGGFPVFGITGNDAKTAFALGTHDVIDEEWHHIVCVRDPNSITIAVDGQESATLRLDADWTHIEPSSVEEPATRLGADSELPLFGGLIHVVEAQGGQITVIAAAKTQPNYAQRAPVLEGRVLDGSEAAWVTLPTTSAPERRNAFRITMETDSLDPGVYEIRPKGSEGGMSVLRALILPSVQQ